MGMEMDEGTGRNGDSRCDGGPHGTGVSPVPVGATEADTLNPRES